MKKRILIAGANPYNANKGVAALAISTIRILNKVAKEEGIDIEICLYNHEFKHSFDFIDTPEGKVRFQNIFPTHLVKIGDCYSTLTSKWKLYNLRELLKCDYIFNITAGDSFSDIYGVLNFCSQNEINKLARLFKKRYAFLPQTYGPFYEEKVKCMAVESLEAAEYVLSRDKESTTYVMGLLSDKKVEDLLDVAFFLPFEPMPLHCGDGVNVGINISQTLWDVPEDSKFSISKDYSGLMIDTINNLLDQGYNVHIIPHVVDSDNSRSNEYYLSYEVWRKINHPRLILAPFFTSPIEAKSYMASLDMFMGARMHACIGAFSSGVPTLLLAYSRKFSGLFKETLGYEHIADMNSNMDSKQLMSMVNNMIDNRSSVRAQISTIKSTIVNKKLNTLFTIVGTILKSL